MPQRSSNTVSVRFLDKQRVLEGLRTAARKLKAKDPRVERVLLFGSLVRGNYAPGSDADIVIVLNQDERRIMDRIPEFLQAFLSVPIDVDVFPYTRDEMARMQAEGNPLIRQALEEGVDLG